MPETLPVLTHLDAWINFCKTRQPCMASIFSSLCRLKILDFPSAKNGFVKLITCIKIGMKIRLVSLNRLSRFETYEIDGVGESTRRSSSRVPFGISNSHLSSVSASLRSRLAFTLIELLVVVTVIALLAGLTLAAVGGVNQKASQDKTKAEIAAISNALEQYKSINDIYPAAGGNGTVPMAAIGPFYIANKIETNASGQLLDPYGQAYQYSTNRSGMKNPASFDVWSAGKSSADSSDDIGNW